MVTRLTLTAITLACMQTAPQDGVLVERELAMHIRNLLSSRLNGISLPAFPDHVPNKINGVAFFELGQGN